MSQCCTQITLADRRCLHQLVAAKVSVNEMARQLGRHREMRRNTFAIPHWRRYIIVHPSHIIYISYAALTGSSDASAKRARAGRDFEPVFVMIAAL